MRAPIFIIGYPRSGTSFVGKLVTHFTGYPSHGESHTLTLLQEIHHQVNLYRKRTDFTGKELVNLLNLENIKALNTKYFRDFYISTYGSKEFIDKTPGAVACHGWQVMKEVFPSSAFIACVRSPVEVYESVIKKFSGSQRDKAITSPISVANGWVGAMKGIENLSKSPFNSDLHIISQLELRSNPRSESTKLGKFLGADHKLLHSGEELCKTTREDVLTDSIHLASYKLLKELNLSSQVEKEFRDICNTTCVKWGIQI